MKFISKLLKSSPRLHAFAKKQQQQGKRGLSKLLKSSPRLHAFTKEKKQQCKWGLILLRCYMYDIAREIKYSGWIRGEEPDLMKMSSELIFYYHKLEKGMCLPQLQRFFGYNAYTRLMPLLSEWDIKGYPKDFPAYVSSIETLRSYRDTVLCYEESSSDAKTVISELNELLSSIEKNDSFSTPINIPITSIDYVTMKSVALTRRSVRHYSADVVELDKLVKAVEIAMLSPSACNRQPCRVHFFTERTGINELLSFQNGNRGFTDNIPVLAIITADQKSFFDSTERIEPIFDGGLFTMSLLYGLTSLGLASCCLNWCVSPKTDRACRERLNISPTEKILTFLAIGYADEKAVVPLSGRRPTSNVYTIDNMPMHLAQVGFTGE
jgi:nitroreductase